ncbi:hypothetical protein H8N01_25050 [Streptomyces sp. AC536]|uniref:hypothetical protein n=1 Tax=Streptomyces buecherae TaxID=2763006 RepID=UPI00164D61E8|nr:hypothetical protein [Streptomyces buecherae]MBC3985752.1 hypothetical protein [Streptomyces buecherae]QNJ44004.1 hypothetical protein H7H31_33410 [Streptomyces buecherae]
MHQLVGATPPRTPEVRKKELTDLAVAAGTEPRDAKKALTFVGFQKAIQDAGPHLGIEGNQAEAIWSMCSALAHGDAHNLSFLDHQVVVAQGNVSLTKLTGNISVLLRAAELSVRMLRHGFALYEKARAAT